MKAAGGATVHVVRPGYEGKKDGRDKAHDSENKDDSFIKSFDILILNDGRGTFVTSAPDVNRRIWPCWAELYPPVTPVT